MIDAPHAVTNPRIPWPSWGKPFEQTLRGYVAWQTTKLPIFAWTLGLLCFIPGAGLLLIADNYITPQTFAALLVVVWLLHFFVLVRPAYPIIREAKAKLGPWRERWLVFEKESLAFQQAVQSEPEASAKSILQRVPVLPSCTWTLSRSVSKPFTHFSLPSHLTDDAKVIAVRHALSRAVCEFVRMGGDAVFAKALDGYAVYAIFRMADNVQFWVRLSFQLHGTVLTPYLVMGVQNWFGPFTAEDGTRYPGDIASLKRYRIITVLPLLACAMPMVGLFVLPFLAIARFFVCFTTNRRVELRDMMRPEFGDSADAYIVAKQKEAISGSNEWAYLLHDSEQRIEAMKGLAFNAVQQAFAPR